MSDIAKQAKELLLQEKHICSYCGHEATQYEENAVIYGPDPYAYHLDHDSVPIWECDGCRDDSAANI